MDFTISSEQLQFVDEVKGFAKQFLNEPEGIEEFSFSQWKQVADFGIFGLVVPEKLGGLNETYLTCALVIEALGYACENNGLIFAINNHIWVCLNLICKFGTVDAQNKYIQNLMGGKWVGAVAITEADAGSDAHSMKTRYHKTEAGYMLNGSKIFVSNGTIADVFIVFAINEESEDSKLTAFIVEKKFEGISIGKNMPKMGLDACPMAEINFEQCLIPDENLLGIEENASAVMSYTLEIERCFEFAPHVGTMQRVMDKCIKYAESRKQFGKNIEEFQAVSHKIADMRVRIELARGLLHKIAWMKDQGKNTYLESSIFKLYVSDNYIQTCRDAIQIFGAYGYTSEYGIEREMRDALASSIYSGTNEVQKNTIYTLTKYELY